MGGERKYRYRYEVVDGPETFECRKTWNPDGGAGRPSWDDIPRADALRMISTHHDIEGGKKALENLGELRCGNVIIRRKRARVKLSKEETAEVLRAEAEAEAEADREREESEKADEEVTE